MFTLHYSNDNSPVSAVLGRYNTFFSLFMDFKGYVDFLLLNNLVSNAKKLKTVIIFDPNVRNNILSKKSEYRDYFENWAKISKVVKLSDEDLTWLGYSVEEILKIGPNLVVVTCGEQGLSGYTIDETTHVAGLTVDVVDSVGAGDVVGAVIVEGLVHHGELVGEHLKLVLERAAKAGAMTCTKAGATPPSLSELE